MNSETKSEPETKGRLIVLPGPTAVGKTGLLEELFSGTGEVISADSMQVYRYLDIGTAKPSKSLQEKLPHHLIDIVEPHRQFHAGAFVDLAEAAAEEITARGKIPVISGGTAFYFQNFLFGLPASPPADAEVRAVLKRRLEIQGPELLYEELRRLDPLSAERIAPADHYRILRALEVFLTSGKPLSAFPRPRDIRGDWSILFIGLSREREELSRRIDLRVETMFEEGLYGEWKSLLRRGYRPEDPGMKSIGYREFFELERDGCRTLGEIKAAVKQNSRRYAKRQMTFFKSLFPPGEGPGRFAWFHPERERREIEQIFAAFWG